MLFFVLGGVAGVLVLVGLYVAFVNRIRRITLRVVRRQRPVRSKTSSAFEIRSDEFLKTTSIVDYFDSLHLLGGPLSLQSLLTAILERYGLALALPFALIIPADLLTFDNKYMVKPKAFAGSLMSSVCLGGICIMAKELGQHAHIELTADGVQDTRQPGTSRAAVAKMRAGSGNAHVLDALRGHENAFQVDSMATLLEEMRNKYGSDRPHVLPAAISTNLPGLRFGNIGLEHLFTVDQERGNEIVSAICNRLCGNLLLSDAHGGAGPFRVSVAGSEATTLEDFFSLLETSGHAVSMEIRTNVTSMGIGLSVLEDTQDPATEALNVPLCFPIKTNLILPQDPASDSGNLEFRQHTELVSLMTHAAVFVKISGPIVSYAMLEWCLNVNGMTGFQGVGGVSRPWQTAPGAYVVHTPQLFATRRKRDRAARLMGIISAVTNAQADADRVVLGGYGYFGVCCDSVALLQAALTEGHETSIYPLLLGGGAKTCLRDAYQTFAESHPAYKKDAERLRTSIQHLPCDIVVDDPKSCAQRCLSSLPTKSIFTAVDTIRAQLQRIIQRGS